MQHLLLPGRSTRTQGPPPAAIARTCAYTQASALPSVEPRGGLRPPGSVGTLPPFAPETAARLRRPPAPRSRAKSGERPRPRRPRGLPLQLLLLLAVAGAGDPLRVDEQ